MQVPCSISISYSHQVGTAAYNAAFFLHLSDQIIKLHKMLASHTTNSIRQLCKQVHKLSMGFFIPAVILNYLSDWIFIISIIVFTHKSLSLLFPTSC